jgi:hypothetical protein
MPFGIPPQRFVATLLFALLLLPMSSFADDAQDAAGTTKGLTIQDGDDHLLRIGGRLQSRLTFEKPDEGDNEIFFNIPRARLALSGYAFSKDLSYKFQADFGKGQASLKDFYMDYAVRKGAFHIRMGQQKRPFSRQFINSSAKLLFVDRATTTTAFELDRDIGIVFHNNMTQSPTFEWALGVLNGDSVSSRVDGTVSGTAEGTVTGTDDDGQVDGTITAGTIDGTSTGKVTNSIDHFEPAIVLRLGYNHGQLKGYSEADLEGGGLRFGIGVGTYATLDMDDDKDAFVRTTIDTMLKVSGFALSGAFFVQMDQDGDSFTDQSMGLMGAFAQASYAIGGQYVPAARFSWIHDDDADTTSQEIAVGFGALFYGHKVKWQTDVAVQMTKIGDTSTSDIVGRSQLQFSF